MGYNLEVTRKYIKFYTHGRYLYLGFIIYIIFCSAILPAKELPFINQVNKYYFRISDIYKTFQLVRKIQITDDFRGERRNNMPISSFRGENKYATTFNIHTYSCICISIHIHFHAVDFCYTKLFGTKNGVC